MITEYMHLQLLAIFEMRFLKETSTKSIGRMVQYYNICAVQFSFTDCGKSSYTVNASETSAKGFLFIAIRH